jgi:hypothetical protein
LVNRELASFRSRSAVCNFEQALITGSAKVSKNWETNAELLPHHVPRIAQPRIPAAPFCSEGVSTDTNSFSVAIASPLFLTAPSLARSDTLTLLCCEAQPRSTLASFLLVLRYLSG